MYSRKQLSRQRKLNATATKVARKIKSVNYVNLQLV